jgi:predicted PilT family ATPase
MTRTKILAPLLLAALALAVVVPAAVAAINWQIALKPSLSFPKATGGAQYQSQSGQRDLQVEVEHVAALAGKRVYFWANGSKFGSAVVSKLGAAQIDRNTELGQSVPNIVHGSGTSARTSAGTVIAQGYF